MSLDGTFCAKESRGVEEINDVHEQTLIEGYANNFKNNSAKYEKSPCTGNLQMNRIS